MDDLLPDGLPKIVYGYPPLKDEQDDIRYFEVDGKRIPIMTDIILYVYSRYDSHVFHYIYESYLNFGYPIPGVPLVERMATDYHSSLEDAINTAIKTQEEIARRGEYTPVFIVER